MDCVCNRGSQQEEVVNRPTEHHGEPADHADGVRKTGGLALPVLSGVLSTCSVYDTYPILPLQLRHFSTNFNLFSINSLHT